MPRRWPRAPPGRGAARPPDPPLEAGSVADLARLSRDEPAPDRVALGPEVPPLIVKAAGVTIDDDAERHAVQTRDDPAVELRRPGVDRHRVELGRVADRPGPVSEQVLPPSPPV